MNGEGEGVPIRPPAIAELEVDSRNRYSNKDYGFVNAFNNEASPMQFQFQSSQALLSGYFTRVAVSEFQLQWKTPNITPRNNLVAWVDSEFGQGDIKYATLPVGFYDLSGVADTLKNEMNLVIGAPTYTSQIVTLIGGNQAIRITRINPAYDFKFQFQTAPTPDDETIKLFKTYQTLGITTLNTTYANSQTIADTASLTYTDYIDIVSDRLAKFAKVKDGMTREFQGQTAILARVYLTPFNAKERFPCSKPFTLAIDYTTPKYIRWNAEEYINNFDLTVYDMYGDVLWWDKNFPSFSTEYQFTLQASET